MGDLPSTWFSGASLVAAAPGGVQPGGQAWSKVPRLPTITCILKEVIRHHRCSEDLEPSRLGANRIYATHGPFTLADGTAILTELLDSSGRK